MIWGDNMDEDGRSQPGSSSNWLDGSDAQDEPAHDAPAYKTTIHDGWKWRTVHERCCFDGAA